MNSELSMDQALIEKLNNILEVNLDKEDFGVKELAKEANLSSSQLYRKLRSIQGKSASSFIREFRLKKAMQLLQNDVATASEISYRVGFSSPTYFNTCFHDYFGYPPGEVKFRNSKLIEDKDNKIGFETDGNEHKTIKDNTNKKSPLTKKMVWMNSVGIILLSVFGYYLYSNYTDFNSEEIMHSDTKKKSIAILPFKNLSSDKGNQYFADGIMDNTLNHLSSFQGLEVKSRQSTEKYRDSDKSMVEIGRELNTDYLLEGSLQKEEDSVRIIIQLIDTKNDSHIWADNYDFQLKQVFKVQSDISRKLANELKTAISEERIEQINKKPTENVEAYNLYLKGRFFWHRRTKEDLIKSIKYFNLALEKDPNYALAIAGLADGYHIMGYWRWMPREEGFKKGLYFAKRALAIDSTIAEAHATLGSIYLHQENRDLEASEAEFKKAISLNPNYATGYHFYADLLGNMGKRKEAIKHIDLALQLNPNSYMMNYNGAAHYVNDGRFKEALVLAKRAVEINPNNQNARLRLFSIYVELGNYNLAVIEMEEYYRLNPNTQDSAKGVRKSFNQGGIEGIYSYMIDVDFKSGFAEEHPYSQALQYAFINDTENAFNWLVKSYKGDAAKIINAINNVKRFENLKKETKYLEL